VNDLYTYIVCKGRFLREKFQTAAQKLQTKPLQRIQKYFFAKETACLAFILSDVLFGNSLLKKPASVT
jgi:hypothetical protein